MALVMFDESGVFTEVLKLGVTAGANLSQQSSWRLIPGTPRLHLSLVVFFRDKGRAF